MGRNRANRCLLVVAMVGCGGHAEDAPMTKTGGGAGSAAKPGLVLHLSTGKQGPPAVDHATLAPATKLGEAEIAALFARTKPLEADPADSQAFALRPNSAPPPQPGQTIAQAFPPPPSSLAPPKPTGHEPRVLRHAPDGAVETAPQLTVTFDQPMVAVTGQTANAAVQPVKLVPQPKGAWRWIGGRTIVFDPEGKQFPKATTYRVEVPAAKAAFSFETPPPSVTDSFPSSNAELETPMFLEFDQKITPRAALAAIHVVSIPHKNPDWGKSHAPIAIELLDKAALAKVTNERFNALVSSRTEADAGRWLAFRAVKPLPSDSTIRITVGPRMPSAEGPNTTKGEHAIDFDTFPPLALTRTNCSDPTQVCRPGTSLELTFSTELDRTAFDPKLVTISPPIPDATITAGYDSISISGETKPATTYRVVVARALRDRYGQTLATEAYGSFRIGDAASSFFGPSGTLVLDPMAKQPALQYFTVGFDSLEVHLYRVTPREFDAYETGAWLDPTKKPPGVELPMMVVKTGKPAQNVLAQTAIDLSPALTAGRGNVVAIVQPAPWLDPLRTPSRHISWVQATHLAVDAYLDDDQLVAFASDLTTGAPVADTVVELRPSGRTAKTDARGLATIELPPRTPGPNYLIATHGDDVALLEGDEWHATRPPPQLAWHVVDDRHLYRPGEQVAIKGWLRAIDMRKHGDVGSPAGVSSVTYVVSDYSENKLAGGSAKLTPLGDFDFTFTLPKTPNLGRARIQLLAHGALAGEMFHEIDVEEFRRPEFEVSASPPTAPIIIGNGGDLTVEAKYYAGGALAGAHASWTLDGATTTYAPPNHDDYSFGVWRPWWGDIDATDDPDARGDWKLDGVTDSSGRHTLHLDAASIAPELPFAISASAQVSDTNSQNWSAHTALIIHPSSVYVGMKAAKPFVEEGSPYVLSLIGVDLDGKPAPGSKIEVDTVRLESAWDKGAYVTKEVEPQHCAVVSAKDPVTCSFATAKGGRYKARATIRDSKGRANHSARDFWVSGGDARQARTVSLESVGIIPDKKDYVAGNTAELLIQSPFVPAEGIVTWRRSGILETQRITITKPAQVITVPITDALVPNLHVAVDLVGVAARLDDHGKPDPIRPKRPAYATGTIELSIPPKQRTLAVTVTPSASGVAPGAKASVHVAVRDAAGAPMPNAEVALFIVDDSVLALGGYELADPLSSFYDVRADGTRPYYSRAYIALATRDDDADLKSFGKLGHGAGTGSGYGVGGGRGGMRGRISDNEMPDPNAVEEFSPKKFKVAELEHKPEEPEKPKPVAKPEPKAGAKPIAVRANFNPLAAFAPAALTSADGTAEIAVTMPDNLTRYRIIAIAAAGAKQFGKGESVMTARLPLMIRPSPPRFLSFGDTFRLPVIVQNQTDAAMTVRVAVRASNLALTDGGGRTVIVPANDRVLVEFPAAAQLAGTARLQLVGVSGDNADAAELSLPVWTPATTEAFATYGTIDSGAISQPVALPPKVVTTYGGVEVSTASTNLQALTDALLYIVHYPFECSEQRSSRILAIASLRDVLTAFHATELPTRAAMEHSIAVDVAWLSATQGDDGGFAFWTKTDPSNPYLSVFVPFALSRAKAKGYAVPGELFLRSLEYLRQIETEIPEYYSDEERVALQAFALYTRKQLGDLDVAAAKLLVAKHFSLASGSGFAKPPPEAAGWLLATLAGVPAAADERRALVKLALDRVKETAGAASFESGYGAHAYRMLGSDTRATGVLLDALIQERKDLDLIPKLVTGLLASRKAGKWSSTQDNGFVLVALERYFHTYENATPDFIARAWIGNDFAGDHAFRGRTTDTARIAIPMADVATHDKQAITIEKSGTGRLYYRIGMTYAPADLHVDPADDGFVVERHYEPIDDPKDVTRDGNGTYHVKAGARVRVKLAMVTDAQRYNVALVDPLPAGFEVMNPELASTGPIPDQDKTANKYWWWERAWYEHQNLRDERVEAFATEVWDGVHAYDYVVRATTRGNYVAPPPKAEEMYMPETFGRGGTDRVIVE